MRFLAAFAVLIALFGAVTPAHAKAMPNCGDVLRQSVKLTADLECPGAVGLVVGADDVTINLNGHKVSGSPALTMTDVNGTTIRNGSVSGDITADNATRTRFVDATVGSRTATYVWNGTTSVTFLRSDINAWRLSCGARCELLRSTFTMNQIGATTVVIRGDQGKMNAINYIGGDVTEIVNTKLNPFRLGASERLTVRNSELDGFELFAPGELQLLHNTFDTGNWVGVHQVGEGVIRGNTFSGMQSAGLFVDAKSTTGPVRVEHNTFKGNRRDGMRVDAPNPLDLTIRNNSAVNNPEFGFWVRSGAAKDGGGNTSDSPCEGIVCV